MIAREHYFSAQALPGAPAAPAAPDAPNARQSRADEIVREKIQQSIREAHEAAQQAAQDAARSAASEGKTVHVGKGGTITIDGKTISFSGLPGSSDAPPWNNAEVIPPQAVDISIAFFIMCAVMVVGWPLARAFGRRIERRGLEPAAIPSVITEQLQRIEQAVDAMSVEVERISESQRFMAKLQNQSAGEQMALPRDRR